jgi:hypothetical protein
MPGGVRPPDEVSFLLGEPSSVLDDFASVRGKDGTAGHGEAALFVGYCFAEAVVLRPDLTDEMDGRRLLTVDAAELGRPLDAYLGEVSVFAP